MGSIYQMPLIDKEKRGDLLRVFLRGTLHRSESALSGGYGHGGGSQGMGGRSS